MHLARKLDKNQRAHTHIYIYAGMLAGLGQEPNSLQTDSMNSRHTLLTNYRQRGEVSL